MFVSIAWFASFWRMLRAAPPVIESFESEAARQLNPQTSQIGESIEATWAGIILGVGTLVAITVAASLLFPSIARRSRHNRIVSAVIASLFLIATVLIIVNGSTLNALGTIAD